MTDRINRRRIPPTDKPAEKQELCDTVLTVRGSLYGKETEERKVLEATSFATNPAYVRVSTGITKNMGDYESLRVEVSLSVPCYVEEIEEVTPQVAAAVVRHLDDAVAAYLEG